jgi:hypothetical protein
MILIHSKIFPVLAWLIVVKSIGKKMADTRSTSNISHFILLTRNNNFVLYQYKTNIELSQYFGTTVDIDGGKSYCDKAIYIIQLKSFILLPSTTA